MRLPRREDTCGGGAVAGVERAARAGAAVRGELNFYDRAIPAIVVEPLKAEFTLSDLDIGLLSAAFTVVYALVGLPLGRLADRFSRREHPHRGDGRRGELYYRLDRAREVTGADLRDGAVRRELHTGLRVARLAGIGP